MSALTLAERRDLTRAAALRWMIFLAAALIDFLGNRAKLGLGPFDVARGDRLDHLLVLGVEGALGGAVTIAVDEALLEPFLGTLDIWHGVRVLGVPVWDLRLRV